MAVLERAAHTERHRGLFFHTMCTQCHLFTVAVVVLFFALRYTRKGFM